MTVLPDPHEGEGGSDREKERERQALKRLLCLSADVSDCESYGNKKLTAAAQQLNMTSSQASLHSVSSSQPDVHPFFKVS